MARGMPACKDNPEAAAASGCRNRPASAHAPGVPPSSIRTIPSAPESHRIVRHWRSRAVPPVGSWALALTLPRRLSSDVSRLYRASPNVGKELMGHTGVRLFPPASRLPRFAGWSPPRIPGQPRRRVSEHCPKESNRTLARTPVSAGLITPSATDGRTCQRLSRGLFRPSALLVGMQSSAQATCRGSPCNR